MSIAKIIEVKSEGSTIEEAIQNAVTQASKTVDSIKTVWTDNIEAIVENNEIQSYRVNAKITFVLNQP